MPLTLVLGPANSAKAGEVLGAYSAAAPRGALLVLPTAADADYYGREVAAGGNVFGTVMTFAGLAAEIARRAGYAARRLSSFQRERIVRRVVEGTSFEVLGEAAAAPGFALAAGELIAELSRSLITAERFEQALRAWAREDPRRGPYARDLAAIPRGYRRALEEIDRVCADLYAWAALDALRAAPGRWGQDPVFFYGFDELTRLERDAVETLARVVGAEVTVSLSYEPGRHAFAARAEAAEELRPLAQRMLELPALDEHYRAGARDALHHLERGLFERGAERIDPGDAIGLLESGGERAEAELIASEVLSLLRSGVPAEEIAVVGRTAADVGPLLERVFAAYGIATTGTRRIAFAHTAYGRGLLALCRCAWLEHAPAEELLTYLRAPGVARKPEVVDKLELEVRRSGLRTAEHARERLGWTIGEIEALRAAPDPAAELARQARRLFAVPYRGYAPTLAPVAERDARALAALLRMLSDLEELDETVSAAELLELLEALELDAPAEHRPGAVLLAEALEVRARRFRAVIVCGLQEGRFPLPGAPEPFLADERRIEIAAASGLALRIGEDATARERYLFYASVSRATERLLLSYRSSDEEGNLELPSPFIADVEELLVDGWAQRRRRRLLADVVWDPGGAPTARELARSRAAAAAPTGAESSGPTLSLSEVALRHVRHSEVLSAGALETYASCPVKWLVERELDPARLEPEYDAVIRGSLIHDVLEELLRRLGAPVSAETLPAAVGMLDELLSEFGEQLAPGRPEPIRAAARRAIASDLVRYLRHEAEHGSGWQPHGLELRFGFEEDPQSLPAAVLGDGEQELRLRGVIDRLDVEPGEGRRAIVLDYKTGSKRTEYAGARWQEDRQLQVALYMVVARALLGLVPVAGLYQPLGGSDLRPRGVFLEDAPVGDAVITNDSRSPEEFEEILDDAVRRSLALASRLRQGQLEPCPQTCSRDGCSYPGICRIQ